MDHNASFESFTRLVHEAYPRLHDRAYLDGHPLGTILGIGAPGAAEKLHRTLIDALEWLRPLPGATLDSVEWRRYRHLQLRYVEGASPERLARELQVSARQARRDHLEGLDELARLLWARLVLAPRATRTSPNPPSSLSRGHAAAAPADPLEAELSSLSETSPPVPTRLDEVVAGVLATCERLAAANGVRIETSVASPARLIRINRTVLRELLLQVLADAIVRFPEARVTLQAQDDPSSVRLRITVWTECPTEGLLSPDVRATVSRIAESQSVVLEGSRDALGEALTLVVPAAPAPTLLLVDDNPDVALLFRRYLAGTSYRLVQARSGERALRLAREIAPDLVILDLLLPSTDGWEVLQALRADPATAGLRVAICSVVPNHALALSLGARDFLIKPVTRDALLALLERDAPHPLPPHPPGGEES